MKKRPSATKTGSNTHRDSLSSKDKTATGEREAQALNLPFNQSETQRKIDGLKEGRNEQVLISNFISSQKHDDISPSFTNQNLGSEL